MWVYISGENITNIASCGGRGVVSDGFTEDSIIRYFSIAGGGQCVHYDHFFVDGIGVGMP